jgi:hypothetical protein
MQNMCNLCIFVSVLNLIFHLKGRTQTEYIGEQGSERIFGPEREEVTGG